MKKIGLLLLVLIACLPQDKPDDIPLDLSNIAEKGDLAAVNFVLRFDNMTIVDTNDPELAEENDVKNYVKGEYVFIVGQSGKVAGFDQAIVGMKIGEKRDSVIVPSEEEIIITLNKTQGMKRSIQRPLKRTFKLSSYNELFGKPPVIGDIIFNEKFPFRYQVL